MQYRKPHFVHLEAVDVGSPVTFIIGDTSDDNIKKAAMITARYSSAKHLPEVQVAEFECDNPRSFTVPPADDKDIQYIIVK